MKYLIDAQLPILLKNYLEFNGFDALHVLNIDETGRMSDQEISKIANEKDRIVITKDLDFMHSHLIKSEPLKLFIISTGNISNEDLISLFKKNINKIDEKFVDSNLIEMSNTDIIIYE